MTKFSHPLLTALVIEHFLKEHVTNQVGAKKYLADVLGVGKTQMNEWAGRILSNGVQTGAPLKKIRRLFWDIETSPNVAFVWKTGFKLNVGHQSIIQERKIICIGYKWEDDKKATVLQWDENKDDKKMLEQFLEIANQADELVAHHGDGFDMPWFRTRCLFHGLQPMPDYKLVDTCKWAKSQFYFNSDSLSYIANFLGLGSKLKTGFDLWKDITLDNCPIAMLKMVTYCAQDVILLQEVWSKLKFFVAPVTHAGVKSGKAKCTCAHCGSTEIIKSKTIVTAAGTVKHQMRCKSCNGYSTINDSTYRLYQTNK